MSTTITFVVLLVKVFVYFFIYNSILFKIKNKFSEIESFLFLDYLNLNSGSCVDLAATYDCELKKQQGLCHLILGNNQPVYVFCAKTCGYCPHEPYLTCAKLAPNTCQMGQCVDVRLFNVPTIKCVCPQSRGGAYCQISNLLHLFDIHRNYFDLKKKELFLENPCLSNPCQNGGICTAQYETPSGSYTCQCPVGYSGAQCQIFDQCYSIYCLNGGYCKLNYVGVPYCECPSGFYGTFCENCEFFYFNFYITNDLIN